ncbi:MAG TPA: ABC transporter ATP-binding protein [Clostridia bacterium]|nr:ABC transporter ATP-binding protein [Clostridia bacterium]
MLRMIKEIRPFIITILIIIALLFVQAMAELALPDYMSSIVNVGIQQKGIEDVVPNVIRADSLEKIKAFSREDERNLISRSYKLLDRGDLSAEEYEHYVTKYPALEKENLYILDAADKGEIERLGSFLGRTILIAWGMDQNMPNIEGDTSPFNDLPQGTDPFETLEAVPQEMLDELRAKAEEWFDQMPDSMITQSAISFISTEYEAIGVNIPKAQSNYILTIGGIMLLIALLVMATSILVGFLSARVSASLGRNLRDGVFRKVASFSNAEFDDFSTASLITRSTNDIQQVQMFVVMLLRMVFYAPIIGTGGVIRALNTDTSMAWIVAVGVMAVLILITVLFFIATPRFKRMQKLVDRVNLVMRESLNGMMVIRAFNTQRLEEDKFDKANKDLTETNLFVSRLMTIMMPAMMLIMNGIMLLIIWVGAHQIEEGTIQVGDMMAFIQYTMQIIMSFLMISMVSIMLPRASVSVQRISEVLDREIIIKDPLSHVELDGGVKGCIEFMDVYFQYPGAEECVLEGITFVAEPGQTTAFIGSTGSGKSTLINLIPRLYDISRGRILLDGIDIRDMRLKDLREEIGYVPQEGILFTGTIESNIKYGKNAVVGEEEVLKSIEIAQAKEFIDEREGGIQSEISQGGTNVSGGQRQRLSIARALAKAPRVLIFDDSFSALDFRTDAALRKAMSHEIVGRTVLIVAQRINTIMKAEKIVVLDEGKIVGQGTHRELLKTCEVYRQIALSQLSEEELAI